ncbi:hypothetical protein BJY01DRAFT_248800 [Aspergillus pseudoustus]|uniref:Uncharacterized protein n=1 Tax=Aspergillus pseudoustus TaxID=1810923 RepID=A0ABR4JSW3_9EURO
MSIHCKVLSLYKKSRILRWIPVLEAEPKNNDPGLLWLSDDATRLPEACLSGPSGPWRQLPTVRILCPTSFCEALLLLLCRDYCAVKGHEFGTRGMWETMARRQVRLNRPLRAGFNEAWEAPVDFYGRRMRTRDRKPGPRVSNLRRHLIATGEILPEEIPEVDEYAMQ